MAQLPGLTWRKFLLPHQLFLKLRSVWKRNCWSFQGIGSDGSKLSTPTNQFSHQHCKVCYPAPTVFQHRLPTCRCNPAICSKALLLLCRHLTITLPNSVLTNRQPDLVQNDPCLAR